VDRRKNGRNESRTLCRNTREHKSADPQKKLGDDEKPEEQNEPENLAFTSEIIQYPRYKKSRRQENDKAPRDVNPNTVPGVPNDGA